MSPRKSHQTVPYLPSTRTHPQDANIDMRSAIAQTLALVAAASLTVDTMSVPAAANLGLRALVYRGKVIYCKIGG